MAILIPILLALLAPLTLWLVHLHTQRLFQKNNTIDEWRPIQYRISDCYTLLVAIAIAIAIAFDLFQTTTDEFTAAVFIITPIAFGWIGVLRFLSQWKWDCSWRRHILLSTGMMLGYTIPFLALYAAIFLSSAAVLLLFDRISTDSLMMFIVCFGLAFSSLYLAYGLSHWLLAAALLWTMKQCRPWRKEQTPQHAVVSPPAQTPHTHAGDETPK